MATFSERMMHNRAFSLVYQDVWRPVFTRLFSLGGSATADYDRALAQYLSRPGDRLICDVACGPGNYTKRLAYRLSGDGHCVGVDFSAAMLERAARTNTASRVTYVRADGHQLPFPDNTFDTVTCFAALYLIPDPLPVIDQLVRICAPGGEIVIFTSVRTALTRFPGVATVATAGGYRMFEPDEITARLRQAGAVDVEQTIVGQGQFVLARKPAPTTAVDS